MRFQFPRNTAFLKTIVQHTGVTHLDIQEIGDGILAVRIEEHYDTFFDTGRWTLTMDLKKGFELTIYPPTLPHAGVLPGRLIKGGVKTVERVLLIVKQKLAPTARHYKLKENREKEERKEEKARSRGKKPLDFASIFDQLGPFRDLFKK